jgi:heme/copper-type cytochrome/quinol oxidase subunit 2
MKKGVIKPVSVAMGVTSALALLLCAPAALAQCAMCRAAAAAAGNDAANVLNTAILVLLIPPVLIFCAIFIVAYRLRAAGGDESREPRKEERESHAWMEKPGASGLDAQDRFKQGWTG